MKGQAQEILSSTRNRFNQAISSAENMKSETAHGNSAPENLNYPKQKQVM